MKSHHKTNALFLLVVCIAFIDGILVMNHLQTDTPVSMGTQIEVLEDTLTPKNPATEDLLEQSAAKSVPFTVQAPIGYWTEQPWSDFAEEACVYMAYKWGSSAELPQKYDIAENLKAIGQWESEHFGSSTLTDIPQTLQMLNQALGYSKAILSDEVSESSLKAALDADSILIVPVNGQVLDSPFYGDPAPEHHMLVIYDYNEEGFITNDPGTRRGEGAIYSIQKILDSVQDLNGERRMILVSR